MRILLVELAGIGDAILSTPAIRNLRRCFTSAYIGLLTLPEPAQIMAKSPYLDRIFLFSQKLKSPLDDFQTLSVLRKQGFDIAINLYQLHTLKGALRMALLLAFIHPKKNLGRNTDNKGFFYNIKVSDSLQSERHDVEYKLDLVRALGCDIKDRQLEVWFDDSDIEAVGNFLKENSISDSDILIGINPGARRPSHRWNWKNFAVVADWLAQKYKARIIITGAKDDSEIAKRISLKMSNPPIDTTGRFSLTELAALIKRCHLYITNDTAAMHIANALEIPLVAIMGPGTIKTAPYQKENCIILKKEVDCSPCYKFKCRDSKCLKQITIDEIIEASNMLIRER